MHPPGKVYIRTSVNRGRRLSGRSNRAAPGWSDGTRMAPEVSHLAVRVMVTALWPAPSEFSQNRAWPLLMSVLSTVQPDGRPAMHGSRAAEGTACADKTIECPVPQTGGYAPSALAGLNAVALTQRAMIAAASTVAASTTRRVPQRCSAIGRRGGEIGRA